MPTTLLYHAFDIKGVTYRSTQMLGNALIISGETIDQYVPCPNCGHRSCGIKGRHIRWSRMPPIGRK